MIVYKKKFFATVFRLTLMGDKYVINNKIIHEFPTLPSFDKIQYILHFVFILTKQHADSTFLQKKTKTSMNPS